MAYRSQVGVVVAAVLMATAWVGLATAQEQLASAGVYTAAQADRGMTIYDGQCASCHELSRFKGKDFASAWADKSLSDLHVAVKSMPMDNPGSLSAQEYADILAYFLSINDYPAGQTELKGDDAAIKAVKVDVKKP
ncbi:MAG: c-type cytochrome [Vicinamibacterales bacterium]